MKELSQKPRKNRTFDMTRGPITGPLILYILPLLGNGIFQQLYNTVDFIFIGNILNKTAAAAAFGLIGGSVLSALAIVFAPQLLHILNTPENVIPSAVIYMRIYMLSVPASVLYNMCSGLCCWRFFQ